MPQKITIHWTKVDEAPALATYSLLPMLQSFLRDTDLEIVVDDISLASRILSNFPEYLREDQYVPDALSELGVLVNNPNAIIIKLPNISASIPQLKSAIRELQSNGFAIPDYPEDPKTETDIDIRKRYSKVLGSAVNPVIREGNADRHAAKSVKSHGQEHPHTMMKPWPIESKTRVAHMSEGDFYENEKSLTISKETSVSIVSVSESGEKMVLKQGLILQKDEVIDTSVMNVRKLREFYRDVMREAKEKGILFSLHLKATMMKISDPIMFRHAVEVFFADILEKYADDLAPLEINFNNGLQDLYNKIGILPEAKRNEIIDEIESSYGNRCPEVAMVNSHKGITNLHIPNNIIIDASVPVVIRDGGKMWGRDDQLHDCIVTIPDRSYATIYQEVISNCQQHGAFDPSTMGTVQNIGLMAQKAEEYGSHDKTFEASCDGEIRVIDDKGEVLLVQPVEHGDIFRMCQTKDGAILNWIQLAIDRARITGYPAVFWLDSNRSHDAEIIVKLKETLSNLDTLGIDIQILSPVEAMRYTLERVRNGENTISVTGNVLRDFLTDLFPILELGTSAKTLSIIPLMNGGGLFETGAGGSAPRHVQQFLKEGHLRWDSLGEFCAFEALCEYISDTQNSSTARVFAHAFDEAIVAYLEHEKSPSRKAGELDNRGSHFYFILYLSRALAMQDKDIQIKTRFEKVAQDLLDNESKIMSEIMSMEGHETDIGGYYYIDDAKAELAMFPSRTLRGIIEN